MDHLASWVLIDELEQHIASHTNTREDHLFLNQYGSHYQKPDSLNKVFRACLRELGIRWRHLTLGGTLTPQSG